MDSGLMTCIMMARHHGIAVDEAQLRHEFGQDRFTTDRILLAAKHLGMKAKVVRQHPERLEYAPLPAIAIDNGEACFIAVKFGYEGNDKTKPKVAVQRPGSPSQILDLPEFLAQWSGRLIYFTSKASIAQELARFDFSWFIPAIVKYRKLLGEILLISFVLQLIGLATPLAFQMVMDKVLVNHALKTLNVIAAGLLCATLFESALSGIRTWVFARTSSKIDVELGARLFRHLLALPIDYFQSRRVGNPIRVSYAMMYVRMLSA